MKLNQNRASKRKTENYLPSSLIMAEIPREELARIAKLSGYDRVLEIDTASRIYGISTQQIEAMLPNLAGQNSPVDTIQSSEKEYSNFETVANTPQRIDKSGMRFDYNPSQDAVQNRQQVTEAILCPTCSAPLGIPSIRPIKITCPACGSESIFNN